MCGERIHSCIQAIHSRSGRIIGVAHLNAIDVNDQIHQM